MRCEIAPVNAPFLMAKKLALQEAKRNRRAVQLHESAIPPPADGMNGSRDELLTSSRLTQNQHRCVGRSHGFHLLQHRLQIAAFAHDLLEVVLGTKLFLEVTLLLFELAAELHNAAEAVVYLDDSRNLAGRLHQHVGMPLLEGHLVAGPHEQNADRFAATAEGNPATPSDPGSKLQSRCSNVLLAKLGHQKRFLLLENPSLRSSLYRQQHFFTRAPLTFDGQFLHMQLLRVC